MRTQIDGAERTREDVIRMAREGGIDTWHGDQFLPNGALMKFARLAAAAKTRKET